MRPDPVIAELVECLTHTARLLTSIAEDLAAREYTARQAREHMDELAATGLMTALQEFADTQP
jgi:predicted ArsR family transcriptional regulator